jgi:putative restriction endonuclease
MNLSPAIATRLEKVAFDNGFDRFVLGPAGWLAFASSQAPLKIWLTQSADGTFIAALSQWNVARALEELGDAINLELPAGAHSARAVTDIPSLHHLVRRAFALSRTLPDELLHTFENVTAPMPRTTEAERLVVQRVGQDIFRKGLIEYWEGRCAITGLAITELLRASHIKPWAACHTDAERLDIFNGLLLAPHLDALFDAGLMTVRDDGCVALCETLTALDREVLGVASELRIRNLRQEHRVYLKWHHGRVFRST